MTEKERVFDENIELKDNAMLKHYPHLFNEWDFEKNDVLGFDIYKVTYGSHSKVWWLGSCGHRWDAIIKNRGLRESGCRFCDGKEILISFNDMWTTNPELTRQLLDPEDGYRYTHKSKKRVDWKCLDCGEVIRNKSIGDIQSRGLSCPRCSDGISFPEKFIYNLLRESDIEFHFDKTQMWSQGKRYDFYLPEYNWIIEVHGIQHYDGRFKAFEGGRTLTQEQHNDKMKQVLARENKVENYIIIDARKSYTKYLTDSIKESDLINLINDEVDFVRIGQLSSISLIKEACNLWNSGVKRTYEIAETLCLAPATITDYLKRGAEIGWCNYCPKKSLSDASRKNGRKNTKVVIQMTKDGQFIRKWKSIKSASEHLGIGGSNISGCCSGSHQTAGGFKWMRENDMMKQTKSE